MKLASGRGIQFFKKPIFSAPKSLVVNTFSVSKKHLSTAFDGFGKMLGGGNVKKKGKK